MSVNVSGRSPKVVSIVTRGTAAEVTQAELDAVEAKADQALAQGGGGGVVVGPGGDGITASNRAAIGQLTYETAPAGSVITDVEYGDQYKVAPLGATDFDTSVGSMLLYIHRSSNGKVKPRMFDFIGDGVERNAQAMEMAKYCRKITLAHIDFDGLYNGAQAVYAYTNNIWLAGIEYLIIDGNGCAFQCLYASTFGASPSNARNECLILPDPHNSNLNDRDNGESTFDYGPLLTVNAAAGDTTITVEAGRGSEFTPGKGLYLYGFFLQSSGYPNTCRAMEYATIREVNGDVITLQGPLTQEFRTDWPPHSAGNWGPARAVSLYRPGKSIQFQRLEINDIEFKRDPAWFDAGEPDGLNFRSGRVWFGNCKNGVISNCICPAGIYGLWCQDITFRGLTVHDNVEIDKNINSITIDGGDIASLSGGTGAKFINLTPEAVVRRFTNISCNERIRIGGELVGAGTGNPAILGTWGCNNVTFYGARLQVDPSNETIMGNPLFGADFTYADWISSGDDVGAYLLTMPLATWESVNFKRCIRNNTVLVSQGCQPAARLRRLPRYNSSTGLVEFPVDLLDNYSTLGTRTLFGQGTQYVDYEDVEFHGGYGRPLNPANTAIYATENIEAHAKHIQSGVFSISNDYIVRDAANYPDIPASQERQHIGRLWNIHKVVVNVRRPWTGTGAKQIRVEGIEADTSAAPDFGLIDLTQSGVRTIDVTGFTGGKGTDTFDVNEWPTNPVSRVAWRRSAGADAPTSREQLPLFTIEFHGSPVAPII